jgi:putative addiction module antidote
MIYQKLRKTGNSYVVTIPKDLIEKLDLTEGDLLAVQVQPAEVRPVVSDDIRKAFEDSWEDNEDGYRYLSEK